MRIVSNIEMMVAFPEMIDKKRKEIKNSFYNEMKSLTLLYRTLGLIKSDRQINERFNKSENYIKAAAIQHHMPKIKFIYQIITDIDKIISNVNNINDKIDVYDTEKVCKELENIKNNFILVKEEIIKYSDIL